MEGSTTIQNEVGEIRSAAHRYSTNIKNNKKEVKKCQKKEFGQKNKKIK